MPPPPLWIHKFWDYCEHPTSKYNDYDSVFFDNFGIESETEAAIKSLLQLEDGDNNKNTTTENINHSAQWEDYYSQVEGNYSSAYSSANDLRSQVEDFFTGIETLVEEEESKTDSGPNKIFGLLSDVQLQVLEYLQRRLSMQEHMDFDAVASKLKASNLDFEKTSELPVSAQVADHLLPPSSIVFPNNNKRHMTTYLRKRKRQSPTEIPSKCDRGTVCHQTDMTFSPMRNRSGELRKTHDDRLFYRFACDACTLQNNEQQGDLKRQKLEKFPKLSDSCFAPDQPMPPHCWVCCRKTKFSKKPDGCWRRICDSCTNDRHVVRCQVRAEFLKNGNAETHDYCNNCGTVKEAGQFTRSNVFGNLERFDRCNACFELLDPLEALWDSRALRALRSIEHFEGKIEKFEANGCCGPAADNSKPCLVAPILERLVNDKHRPINERGILLHCDHAIRWLKSRHLSYHSSNPIDCAVDQMNTNVRCAACHMVKTLNCGDFRPLFSPEEKRPDAELSETDWEKIYDKIAALDRHGCCGDNKHFSGSCPFQKRWKELRQMSSLREMAVMFHWDHDLDNCEKEGDVSHMAADKYKKEQEKCHLRCIFCHGLKSIRCGDLKHPKQKKRR